MYSIYEIKSGDSLDSIANRFNTSVDNLISLNSNIESLGYGDQIIVPNNVNSPFIIYTVKKGDTLYEIARKNNLKYKDLILINGLKEDEFIYPDQKILIPKEEYKLYITKEGDTLKSILKNLNIDFDNMLNNNKNIYLLGEQLILYKN